MNCVPDPPEVASGTVEVDGIRLASFCMGVKGAVSAAGRPSRGSAGRLSRGTAGRPSKGTGGRDVASSGTFNTTQAATELHSRQTIGACPPSSTQACGASIASKCSLTAT